MKAEAPRRLLSIDALRGLDMVWIVGGSSLLAVWAEATRWEWLQALEAQCHHVEWNGFRLWDLVFPLFLFLAGVSLPFSLGRRLDGGASRAAMYRHVGVRALLMVLLGAVYNGLLNFDLESQRWASVLGRIGLAWAGAAVIWLHCKPRGQAMWLAGLLLGYWALLTLVPVPGVGAPSLEPGANLADWFDRTFLPGRLHREVRDPEGLLATLPAIGTALMGILTGGWLRRPEITEARRSAGLVLAGAASLALGGLWQLVFPLNKNLWTSSFVLWTGGLSLLLLAVFHCLIDVARIQRPFRPLIHFGANAILIYMLHRFVDFDALAALILQPAVGRIHGALLAAGGLGLEWALLAWMYRRKLFLKL
jgi:predicted acyltransferase